MLVLHVQRFSRLKGCYRSCKPDDQYLIIHKLSKPGSPSNAPVFPMQTIPGGTINPIIPQSVPNNPTPQSGRRSEAPDGVTPLAFAATSSAPRSLFSQLMSTGPDPLLAVDAAISPPLQADATQDAADNGPTRFLVGRTYDSSQGSPFAAPPAPSPPSPDGSLSLNDAYLEYLKRLNA